MRYNQSDVQVPQQPDCSRDSGVAPVERFQMIYDKDNEELKRLGKRPVLKRNFGFMSMFGFNCTVMTTWEMLLPIFGGNFANGGYAGAVYGFIFCWIGTLCVFSSMAEMSSMAPTSGGQYHWVSMLAPRRYQKFTSYVVGWFNVIGWQAIVTLGGFECGNLIQGLVVLNNPDYSPTRWQTTLLLWATIVFAVFINTIMSGLLPKIEGLILILHVTAFFGILIPLVYISPHTDPHTVFTAFIDQGNWPTQGLSFFVGLLASANVMLGSDAAVHLTVNRCLKKSEMRRWSFPGVIIASLLLNGTLAFLTLLSLLFCLGDPEFVFNYPGYPFIAVFVQGIGNTGGVTAMVSIITFLIIFAAVSFVATGSRMMWAFARDRGLPGWRYLSKIEPRTSMPLVSIFTTTIIACLLGLINIGSSVAFEDVLSLIIAGLFTSYLIGNSLLLWHRVRRTIGSYNESADGPTNVVEAGKLTWGPWRIPEPWGTVVNAVGLAYLIIILFFSYWPTKVDPGAEGMNYSILVIGVLGGFSIIYYWIWARRVYVGPVIEVDFGR